MESLALDVEQIVELGLATIGVFDLFAELALVVFDHLLLLLKLVGAAFEHILLLIEMAFAFEQFFGELR